MAESKDVSLDQENKLAKMFGGSRTPRSGGGAWKKGDVLVGPDGEGWLIEAKCTVKPSLSYSVNKAVLDKMDHERAEMHKPYAALAFQLGETREDYFVVTTRTMKAILDTQNGIKALIASLQRQLEELEERKEKLQYGNDGISSDELALYNAHKAEKRATIEELGKLV